MSKDTFVQQYQDVANRAGEKLGVNPNILLAQWGLETGWGKSIIPGTNNLGNIKDFSGKGVEATDNQTQSRDKYRAYADADAFADDYVNLIKRRYPAAVGQKTAVGFATALKDGGYAEDAQYVQKVAQAAGEQYTPPTPSDTPKTRYEALIQAGVQASVMRPTSRKAFESQLAQSQFERQVREEARPTWLEPFGAAVAGAADHRLVSGIVDRLWGEEFDPVPGYTPDLKALPPTADSDLIAEYATATSPAAADKILKRHEDTMQRNRAVFDGGMLKGVALSIAAEGTSVTNWVAPFAAAKTLARLGTGSLALAQEGRTGASIAASITENIVSGTAVEAVAQGMEGRLNGQDLLISLAADSLMGIGTGIYGVKAVAQAERLTDRAAISAMEHELSYAARAEAELGSGASTGDLRKVMDRLYQEDLNAAVKGAVNDIPSERKLIKEPEQVAAQADAAARLPEPAAQFNTPESLTWREAEFASGGTHEWAIANRTGGAIKTLDELHNLPAGIHYVGESLPVAAKPAVDTAMKLARKFLGDDFRITIVHRAIPHTLADGRVVSANGDLVQVSDRAAMMSVDPALPVTQQIRTVVHEVGHAIFNKNIGKLPADQRGKLAIAFDRFLAEADAAPTGDVGRAHRFSILNSDQAPDQAGTPKLLSEYERDWDEFSAEQLTKYVEDDANGANSLGLAKGTVAVLKAAIQQALEFLGLMKRKHLGVSNEYKEFFDMLANSVEDTKRVAAEATQGEPTRLAQASVPAKPADVVNELMTDPDAVRYGINLAPVSTATERKHAQAMLALHKQAAEWEKKNPMDAAYLKRVDNLADNNVFNVASTGLLMLKSPNPLVRMIASELLEDASGVAGKRQATAAISKYMTERFMLDNTINDVQSAYQFWKKGKPGGLRDDLVGGNNWAAFNKEIAAEIEARRLAKAPVSQDPNIKAAADSLEAAYQRTANAQRQANTLGSKGLPGSSVGYMPHRMSPKAVINMTNEQSQILHSALVDQFITIEGWDASFSDKLASSYIKRVRDRASGDYGSNVGGANPGTASLVEEALRGMDLPEDTIKQHMDKFAKGGANFTKKRIELDLNKVYQTADGEFRLLDIFETNQLELLRSQAGRASGEVALTKWGVRGKPGLKLLRDAMGYGEDGKRAGVKEMESFDQIAAEFMNEPFGTQSGKFMERAMAANTLVRLGGIVFNQIAESLNGIMHVGLARTAASVASIPRLRGEIKALARGEKIDNPFLSSIEYAGGAEFGTDAYKIVMPFDSPDHAYPTYGQDTLTLTDRLLRGGGHLQSKLSGWRMVHSAQQRGMAEQIVHKMAKYLRDGKDDVALQQFGITPEMRAALRSDLPNVATFDGAGNLVRFDVTKITDPAVREQVIQAVWRGTSQIIQGTYIGERGKWAHDGWLKLLTQFRSFSITSMEKQWGRQRNSRGAAAAYGLLIGSMSMAWPVYMARVYASSIGRPDQEEYLEERLQFQNVARATLNYVAMTGMAGDFIDLLSATLPEELGVKPTGGRAGVETDFVGNYVLPASSLVNDIWKYAQSPLEVDDAIKIMPMSRLPYLVPLMNGARE